MRILIIRTPHNKGISANLSKLWKRSLSWGIHSPNWNLPNPTTVWKHSKSFLIIAIHMESCKKSQIMSIVQQLEVHYVMLVAGVFTKNLWPVWMHVQNSNFIDKPCELCRGNEVIFQTIRPDNSMVPHSILCYCWRISFDSQHSKVWAKSRGSHVVHRDNPVSTI